MPASQLPELPPDIRFELLSDCAEAIAFSFAVKKEALGPHIRARWPWDDDYQQRTHQARFAEKPFYTIRQNDSAIGTVSWAVYPEYARFGEFYFFQKYQGRGLGTRILKHALTQADAAGLPVCLEYLKWNPVGSLYLRNGFSPVHETDIHVFLKRPPNLIMSKR